MASKIFKAVCYIEYRFDFMYYFFLFSIDNKSYGNACFKKSTLCK